MQQILPAVILILAAVSVWIFLVLYLKRSSRRVLKNFSLLVKKYGLTLDESNKSGFTSYPVAFGEYGGKVVEIGSRSAEFGSRKIPQTYVKILCENPEDISIRIIRNTKLNEIEFGSNSTGDPEFDRFFIVVFDKQDAVKKIPGEVSRMKLIQAAKLGSLGEISLKKDTVLYSGQGLISNETRLLRIELILHAMIDIADEAGLKG